MLEKANPFRYSVNLIDEPLSAKQEGKDATGLEEEVSKILAMDDRDPKKEELAAAIYDRVQALPILPDYSYVEPSDLEGIFANRPKSKVQLPPAPTDKEVLFNKIHGAWLGRCAGCLLGKPIEGWDLARITGFLKETNNYPVHYYLSSDVSDEMKEKYNIVKHAWINNVKCAPADDDTNYTVLGLKVFESYGPDFQPFQVAEAWLRFLPILSTCTAERIAYRNFVNGIIPPHSGGFRNPYRELIGAQIRGDFFGYVAPGNPALAAEYAWRDACISHVKNGIYGEMFVAAMLAAAAVSDDIQTIINAGLSQIPEKCRLAEQIKGVLTWKSEGLDSQQAIERIHTLFNEKNFDWVHTISNAVIVCASLIYGEKDLEKTIGFAVMSAFDTDCNGATAGSIVGMILGADKLPEKWIAPLNGTLESAIAGYGSTSIAELAEKTLSFVNAKAPTDAGIGKDEKRNELVQNVE